MRTITHFHLASGTTLTTVDMTTFAPIDMVKISATMGATLNKKYMATVEDVDTKTAVFVDMSSLVTMTDLISRAVAVKKIATGDIWIDIPDLLWEDVAKCITDEMVLGYKQRVPDFKDSRHSLRFVQLLHTSDFGASYCMLETPEDRNVKFRRWQLLDLAVTKLNKDHPVDLNHCLLSVNGCISRPIMFKNELLMARGAEFMHNNTIMKTPSVTLLDFTNLGGLKTIPFSDCQYKIRTGRVGGVVGRPPIVPGYELEVVLPKSVELKDKHVWMVLGHSLFFNESVRVNSESSIVIAPHMLPLGTCLLKTQYHSRAYKDETTTLSSGYSIVEYLNNVAWASEHHGAFFIVMDVEHMYIRKTSTQQYAKERMFIAQQGTQGLLWDNTTHSFFDHTCFQYTSLTDFYAMPNNDLSYLTAHDYFDSHFATEEMQPYYKQYLRDNTSDMCVIEITRG